MAPARTGRDNYLRTRKPLSLLPGDRGFESLPLRHFRTELRTPVVEQRHDLPHHDAHGIVAHLLGDGDELHAVLDELADVEFQLEVIAEEPREAVDDNDIEGRGLRRAGLNHPLELGS